MPERIAAGDLFQANLCLRLEGRLEGDALDLFATAAPALPTDRAAFVAGPWGMVASLSPELFLARRGRTGAQRADQGHAPGGPARRARASAKDRAENVMIVDLVRNDLGRVCRPGSVRVAALAEVRPHAGVWHLVSEVEGELRDGVRDADLLRATFPPGSVTGAPKLAALDVIAELESTGREAYTGAIGFASPVAGLELSVAIRTFEFRGARMWLGAGGGIVADSDPAAEAREAAAKAAPLLAAIGATPSAARRRRRGQTAGRILARRGSCGAARGRCPGRIPRPACTRPCWCAARAGGARARTWPASRASLRALYGIAPPDDLAGRAVPRPPGRARAAADRRHARRRRRASP